MKKLHFLMLFLALIHFSTTFSQLSSPSMRHVQIKYQEDIQIVCKDKKLQQIESSEKFFYGLGDQWKEVGVDKQGGYSSTFIQTGNETGERHYYKSFRTLNAHLQYQSAPMLYETPHANLQEVEPAGTVLGYTVQKGTLAFQGAQWRIVFTTDLDPAGLSDAFWGKIPGVPGVVLERERIPSGVQGELLECWKVLEVNASFPDSAHELPPSAMDFSNLKEALAAELNELHAIWQKETVRKQATAQVLGTYVLDEMDKKTSIAITRKEGQLEATRSILYKGNCPDASLQSFKAELHGNQVILLGEGSQGFEIYHIGEGGTELWQEKNKNKTFNRA